MSPKAMTVNSITVIGKGYEGTFGLRAVDKIDGTKIYTFVVTII